MISPNKKYFCLKKNIEITMHSCAVCFANEENGSADYEYCLRRNLKIIEDKKEE